MNVGLQIYDVLYTYSLLVISISKKLSLLAGGVTVSKFD